MTRVTVLRAALLTLLFPQALGAAEVESRCTQLGSSCLMSEPLNTNQYVIVSAGGQAPGDEVSTCARYLDVDFGDTEGSARKEASQALTDCRYNAPIATRGGPADAALPTTASGINYVMRAGVGPAVMIDRHNPSGNKRMCMRHYHKFSNPFSNAQVCGSDKLMEVWTNQTSIQMTEYSDLFMMNVLGNWSGYVANTTDNVRTSPTQMRISDCMSNWCRMEMCISTTDADIRTMTNVTVDGYVTQVGVTNPKSGSWNPIFAGNSLEGGLGEAWPYVTYRQNYPINPTCSNADINQWGYSYYSHVMKAAWPTNSGQYIGAAGEIEGGGSGATSPAPAPTPLAPPILLP